MLTEERMNLYADIFQERFSNVNIKILEDIGKTLKKTGDLTPSQAKKLQQMYSYGEDLDSIKRQLSKAVGVSIKDIENLYDNVAKEGYEWSKPFYDAKGIEQIPFKDNKQLQSIIKSAVAVTVGEFKNISRTTQIGIKDSKGFTTLGSFYKKAVDNAITAVATGTTDYNSAIRQSIKELGNSGLRVKYTGNYTKRLDSAIRQNVLDGVSYVAQEISRQNGKEFGADGVELSAHSPCAPDHLPHQGKQFSNKEFERLQGTLTRPIGEWNCHHMTYPIILGVSKPAHSQKELAEINRQSNEKIKFEGQEYTRYECTQLQRQLETKLRYTREEKALYKAVGDTDLELMANEKIRLMTSKYAQLSKAAGIPTRLERAKVAAYRNRLDYGSKSDIIKLAKGHSISGKVSLNYVKVDVSEFKFDDVHINAERLHNVTREEAIRFIDGSKVLFTRWKGQYLCYYGSEGNVYVDIKNKLIRTAYKREEFDPETLKFMKGVEKLI